MRTASIFLFTSLSILLVACSSDTAPPIDGGRHDGGGRDSSPSDIGLGVDSGPGDSGGAIDTGTTDDAGTLTDAGTMDDLGTTTDAGGGTDAGSGTDSGSTGTCSPACASPFVCAPGGYCASTTGVPAFDHVYTIVFENRSLPSVMGHAAYLDGLATANAYGTNYISVAHPSLPNYLAMTSGDVWGVSCDCHPTGASACVPVVCLFSPGCNCHQAHTNFGDQLDGISAPWREYAEDMGASCNTTDSGHYAVKHVPFLYYDDVYTDSTRCALRVRDYGTFAGDIGAMRFSYISPNLCNDMHDDCTSTAVAQGNLWASTAIPPILAQSGFAAGGHDVLFLVWDEEDGSAGTAPIPFIVVSPLVTPGAVTAHRYDHYSLLATWEDAFGVSRLAMAAGATPVNDIWR